MASIEFIEKLETGEILLEDDEDYVPNDLDDLITDAQDAYFEGRLDDVVKACESALKLNPKETDAYELLSLSLFQLDPPNYEKAANIATQWGKNLVENQKQLTMLLRSSYHLNNVEKVREAAKRLVSISSSSPSLYSSGPSMQIVLAAALLSDLGEHEFANELRSKLPVLEKAEDTIIEWVRLNSLFGWIDFKNAKGSSNGVEKLQELIESNSVDTLGIGLAYSLKILASLEKDGSSLSPITDDQTKDLLSKIQKNEQLSGEDNLICIRALIQLIENGSASFNPTLLGKIKHAALGANDLIKKRVEQKLLYPSNK